MKKVEFMTEALSTTDQIDEFLNQFAEELNTEVEVVGYVVRDDEPSNSDDIWITIKVTTETS